GERQGLPGAVPLQRQDQQADVQPRAGATGRRGPQEDGGSSRQSERLGGRRCSGRVVGAARGGADGDPARCRPRPCSREAVRTVLVSETRGNSLTKILAFAAVVEVG